MVTVNGAVPLTPLCEAVTVVDPEAIAVASPELLIDATVVFVTAQLAVEVTSFVDPSLYVAVAVNCCVAPIAKLVGLGVIERAVTVFAPTVTVVADEAAPPVPVAVAV
jgi:hypothetical protein